MTLYCTYSGNFFFRTYFELISALRPFIKEVLCILYNRYSTNEKIYLYINKIVSINIGIIIYLTCGHCNLNEFRIHHALQRKKNWCNNIIKKVLIPVMIKISRKKANSNATYMLTAQLAKTQSHYKRRNYLILWHGPDVSHELIGDPNVTRDVQRVWDKLLRACEFTRLCIFNANELNRCAWERGIGTRLE